MKRIRITAVRKADYKDLQQKYENPIEHACSVAEAVKILDSPENIDVGANFAIEIPCKR